MPSFGETRHMPRRNVVKSLREIDRFLAVDEEGRVHTVAERREVATPVLYGIRAGQRPTGVSSFYSATSGDRLELMTDGSLEGRRGALRLRRVEPGFSGQSALAGGGEAKA